MFDMLCSVRTVFRNITHRFFLGGKRKDIMAALMTTIMSTIFKRRPSDKKNHLL